MAPKRFSFCLVIHRKKEKKKKKRQYTCKGLLRQCSDKHRNPATDRKYRLLFCHTIS